MKSGPAAEATYRRAYDLARIAIQWHLGCSRPLDWQIPGDVALVHRAVRRQLSWLAVVAELEAVDLAVLDAMADRLPR